MVKIGTKFFAPEWFDLDRSEKMVSFFGDEPLPDDSPLWQDEYEPEPIYCPRCGDGNLEYIGEQFDDEEHIGSFYKCDECGHEFSEHDAL